MSKGKNKKNKGFVPKMNANPTSKLLSSGQIKNTMRKLISHKKY